MNPIYNIADDWNLSEIEYMMNHISLGYTYEILAVHLNKDVANLKKTLLSIICQKIKNNEGIKAYYCNEYGVTVNEIEEHMELDNI